MKKGEWAVVIIVVLALLAFAGFARGADLTVSWTQPIYYTDGISRIPTWDRGGTLVKGQQVVPLKAGYLFSSVVPYPAASVKFTIKINTTYRFQAWSLTAAGDLSAGSNTTRGRETWLHSAPLLRGQ